jgi:fatty acid desaturase
MGTEAKLRDYSLTGPEAKLAVEKGLSGAEWRVCAIPRKELKELMRRTDGPALRDTGVWLAALAVSGVLSYHFWGTWWAVPCFLVYGVLYGSASDSRWHECSHGTAFKTTWLNDVVYHLACFMILREPTIWRWSHTRHHTDTIIVGRDPEIAARRPPDLVGILLNLFALKSGWQALNQIVLHAIGRLSADEASFVPETERWKVFLVARLYLAVFGTIVFACVATRSILPALYIGLPTFYGGFMVVFFGLTQHAGLAEDVLDHRLNSRTVYMNLVFRFLYWNMNYHVEHHMFPMVPYHALPRLHEAIKPQCPLPYRSTIQAYREIIPALLRQLEDPNYFVKRELPRGVAEVAASAPDAAAAAI